MTPVCALPVGTSFTYQGFLEDGGDPANAAYDFRFQLFDDPLVGEIIGEVTPVQIDNVAVFDGLFTVTLDFGEGAFAGGARWLAIGVRAAGSANPFVLLSPRQPIAPAPVASSLPNVYTDESINFVGVGRDFRVSGNEVFGLRYQGGANQYGGMYMETEHAQGWPFYGYATNGSFRAWTYYNGANGDWYLYNAGIKLRVPNEGGLIVGATNAQEGLRIGSSAAYSLVIANTSGSDGIRIYKTGDDAIQIGSSPNHSNYGVYIPSPGVTTYGLWPNTSNAAGEWALFTVDKIEAGNVKTTSLSIIGQVGDSKALEPGDVVGASGVTKSLPGGHDRLPLVKAAVATDEGGVIGVVESRMAYLEAPGKEGADAKVLHSVTGSAQPGDYISLKVIGVTEVKVSPESKGGITAGQRLTVSELSGLARPLKTQKLNGMSVMEGAPVIGTALAAPVAASETIPVFVNLR
jgi:hypothetical protein